MIDPVSEEAQHAPAVEPSPSRVPPPPGGSTRARIVRDHVIACGTRLNGWPTNRRAAAKSVAYRLMRKLQAENPDVMVHEGGANGSDQWFRDACAALGLAHERHDADWSMGPGGGPARNSQMLRDYRPYKVIALTDRIETSYGTLDMIAKAHQAGVPIEVWRSEGRRESEAVVRRALQQYSERGRSRSRYS